MLSQPGTGNWLTKAAVAIEHLQPAIAVVAHVYLAGRVDRDAHRLDEAPGLRALTAPLLLLLPGCRETHDAVLARVGDEHGPGGVHRDAAWSVKAGGPLAQEPAFRREYLHALVPGVGDEDLPVSADRDTARLFELPYRVAQPAPLPHDAQITPEFLNAVVAEIAHEHVAVFGDGDAAWLT